MDLSRLCIHTITTRPWSLDVAIEQYSRAGIGGISVWRQALAGQDVRRAGERIGNAGLQVVSLCRAGFFTSHTAAERRQAIDGNLTAIDEAAALGAPLLVLVCGATPGQPLELSRQQIETGIAAILPHAESCGVRLGIEALHPMYAADRSAVNTLAQAIDMAQRLGSPQVGVVLDVYHVWWDPHLYDEIARCGRLGRLFAVHLSDWKVPTTDMLNDRGLMGEGCIPLAAICRAIQAAGFGGFYEVEIFSSTYWQMNQKQFLQHIIAAYTQL